MGPSPEPPDGALTVGIDAGGSHVDAVAVNGREVVFRGRGGPGNPMGTDRTVLAKSYRDALAGCPTPERVGACVAGCGAPKGKALVTELLSGLLPGVALVVGPDYLAAIHAAPVHDMWVIAGTGSLVASWDTLAVSVSGGRGWLLGDHGSAARLGRALLERYVDDPGADPALAAQVAAVAGTSDWREIVRQVQSGLAPGAWMAQFASLLCHRAESGDRWAAACLDQQMAALAEATGRHARSKLGRSDDLSVRLVGGVWRSSAATHAFEQFLGAVLSRPSVVSEPDLDLSLGAAAYAWSEQ